MYFALTLGLVNFGLYCFQQFGMALGIGAETVLLVAYLQSIRDGVVDEEEKGFARATRHVMDAGLFLILVTGAGVVVLQYLMGQPLSIFSTAFLFKWSLLGIILVMTLLNRGTSLVAGLLQGLAAGTWYAMFVVHILAPEATWQQFGEFYGAWLVGFMVCWTVLVFALKGKAPTGISKPAPIKSVPQTSVVINPSKKPEPPKPYLFAQKEPVSPAPTPRVADIPPPPPAPAPVMPPPTPPTPTISAASATPPTPAPQPTTPPAAMIGLNVMPKDPKDIEKR